MKNITILILLICATCEFAFPQNTVLFYKNSQADLGMFHHFYFDTLAKQYHFIGSTKLSHYYTQTFRYIVYDQEGNLINLEDINQVYTNGNLNYSSYGGAWFFQNRDFIVSYGIKIAGIVEDHIVFLDNNKDVVWRDLGRIAGNIDDTNLILLSYNDTNYNFLLKKTGYQGSLIWEYSNQKYFPTEVRCGGTIRNSSEIILFAHTISGNPLIFYKSFISGSGDLLKIDSFQFGKSTTVNIRMNRHGFFANEYLRNTNDSIEEFLYVLDTAMNILWHKNSTAFSIFPHYAVDKDGNYNIIIELPEKGNDTTTVFRYYKVSKKGVQLKEFEFTFRDKISISKFVVTEDNGFFLIGKNAPVFGGIWGCFLMKTDSNFNYKTVSIENRYENFSEIIVFPNPLNTTATFALPIQPTKNAVFRLYSLTSKLVREEKITGNNYLFHRNNLPEGMYIYSITSNEQRFVGKLMIE